MNKVCARCGKPLPPNRNRYCNAVCAANPPPKFICQNCGKEFLGRRDRKGLFCSRSCYAKSKWLQELGRRTALEHLAGWTHTFKFRGGNGTPMPPSQSLLQTVLNRDWIPEYAISLGRWQPGYPKCYKVDFGNPTTRIAIEIDGNYHNRPDQQHKDMKKDKKLRELGWSVLRLSNTTVLKMFTPLQ